MYTTMAMFPHKPTPVPTRNTLPHHLWPKTVRQDFSNIQRRARIAHRLITLETGLLAASHKEPTHRDTLASL